MKIITIDCPTNTALTLLQPKDFVCNTPEEVVAATKAGKPSDLIGWHDEGSFGFYHKKKAVTIELSKLENAAVTYMTRAKGTGWIALEIEHKDKRGILPILESKAYKQEALGWFKDKSEVL